MAAFNADTDHVIDWYHPARGGRGPESSTGAVISHLPGVKAALSEEAHSLGVQAEMALAGHRKTGAAQIEVEHHALDWYVKLTDPDPGGNGFRQDRSAMSIEFGWHQTHAFGHRLKQPIHHDGLHILQGVIDRAAARHRGR